MLNTFEKRGVIVAKGTSEITLDNAEEDAIEFGAEEVTKNKGRLQFTILPPPPPCV